MLTAAVLLLVASASAAPQFDNIFKALSGSQDKAGEYEGDNEQVPYTTLKEYDVSHFTGKISVPSKASGLNFVCSRATR